MKKPETAKATAPLAEYAPEVKTEPVVLTVKGKPVAPLVSIKNAAWETATLSRHSRFLL